MYKIIGADQKEYGPISANQVRRWIAEGRLNGQTRALADGGTEWKELSSFTEFADALSAQVASVGPPPVFPAGAASFNPADLLARDYELDIIGCITNAWNLLQNNFAALFGGCAFYFLIVIGLSLVGQIPIVGILASLGSLVITGPLMGGVYYLFLQMIRRQPATATDVFAGFRKCFVQLMLGYLAMAALMLVCLIPAIVVALIAILPAAIHHRPPETPQILITALAVLICFIPLMYLSVSWFFCLPLIIDKGLTFWPAMETSRKMVGKHWWSVFAFLIVCGLINVAGFCACCIGIFFAMPVVFGATMYAYESIFNPRRQTT